MGRENTFTRASASLSFIFVVETIRYHYYCMLEQGGMLLKFIILHLHYVTHYGARIECQPCKSSPEVIQQARFAQYGKIILKPLKNCFL